jgi:hypothetical protein
MVGLRFCHQHQKYRGIFSQLESKQPFQGFRWLLWKLLEGLQLISLELLLAYWQYIVLVWNRRVGHHT